MLQYRQTYQKSTFAAVEESTLINPLSPKVSDFHYGSDMVLLHHNITNIFPLPKNPSVPPFPFPPS
jgi:hypothetical protein